MERKTNTGKPLNFESTLRRYIRRQFRGLPGFKLAQLLPRPSTLACFAATSMVCLASQHVFMQAPGPVPHGGITTTLVFLKHASGHVAVGVACIAGVGIVVLKGERELLSGIKALSRRAD